MRSYSAIRRPNFSYFIWSLIYCPIDTLNYEETCPRFSIENCSVNGEIVRVHARENNIKYYYGIVVPLYHVTPSRRNFSKDIMIFYSHSFENSGRHFSPNFRWKITNVFGRISRRDDMVPGNYDVSNIWYYFIYVYWSSLGRILNRTFQISNLVSSSSWGCFFFIVETATFLVVIKGRIFTYIHNDVIVSLWKKDETPGTRREKTNEGMIFSVGYSPQERTIKRTVLSQLNFLHSSRTEYSSAHFWLRK